MRLKLKGGAKCLNSAYSSFFVNFSYFKRFIVWTRRGLRLVYFGRLVLCKGEKAISRLFGRLSDLRSCFFGIFENPFILHFCKIFQIEKSFVF